MKHRASTKIRQIGEEVRKPLKVVLASRSPRRAELLTAAGIRFTVRTADIDETPRVDENPSDRRRSTKTIEGGPRLAVPPPRRIVDGRGYSLHRPHRRHR